MSAPDPNISYADLLQCLADMDAEVDALKRRLRSELILNEDYRRANARLIQEARDAKSREAVLRSILRNALSKKARIRYAAEIAEELKME